MECDAIAPTQMGDAEISAIDKGGAMATGSAEEEKATVICSLVFITCIECVTKSRMTGDCHVRFREQPRGEIPFG